MMRKLAILNQLSQGDASIQQILLIGVSCRRNGGDAGNQNGDG